MCVCMYVFVHVSRGNSPRTRDISISDAYDEKCLTIQLNGQFLSLMPLRSRWKIGVGASSASRHGPASFGHTSRYFIVPGIAFELNTNNVNEKKEKVPVRRRASLTRGDMKMTAPSNDRRPAQG